jgi:hypothetical protein
MAQQSPCDAAFSVTVQHSVDMRHLCCSGVQVKAESNLKEFAHVTRNAGMAWSPATYGVQLRLPRGTAFRTVFGVHGEVGGWEHGPSTS